MCPPCLNAEGSGSVFTITSRNNIPLDKSSNRTVGDAFLLFFVSLLLVIVVGTPAQMASISIGLSVTEILLILLPALVYVRLKRQPLFESLRWRPVAPAIALRCVLLGALGWGMAVAVYLATVKPLGAILGPDPSAEFFAKAMPSTIPELALFLIVMAVLPGLCEETLFRGAILPILEKKGVRKGIIYTALLFAAFHVSPWAFLPAFGLGMLLGMVTIRTNSTLPAMICHACNNAMAVTVAFLYRKTPEHEPYLLVGVLAVLFVVVLVEFLYRTRGLKRESSPLTSASAKLSRRLKLVIIVTVTTTIILVFVAARVFLGAHRMMTDSLAPEINREDIVIVLKGRFIELDIQPGDVISFKRDGRTMLRKVTRMDDNSVWILEKASETEGSETELLRSKVISKMIYKYTLSK